LGRDKEREASKEGAKRGERERRRARSKEPGATNDRSERMNEQIADAVIEQAKTERGGWTRKQLAEWGVPWPHESLIELDEHAVID
jgi:hypothetical protein